MPNAKDDSTPNNRNILLVGPTGSGKSTQILTLPGKKFVYIFDPIGLEAIRGHDVEYELFLPDKLELDATLKGFNKGSKSDAPGSKLEPTTYLRWVEDLTAKAKEGFFKGFDWVCFDSATFLQKACMDRNLYINSRYGKIEELSDYRVVGSKMSDLFRSITSEDINIFCTGHIDEFQDEKTKKITVQLKLHGQARSTIPLMFSEIWLAKSNSTEKIKNFQVQTRPDQRGLQTIRSSINSLEMFEDVTIHDFSHPEKYGIGKILTRHTN